MNLLNYYQKRGVVCDIRTDEELKQDISNLLGMAVMLEAPGLKSTEKQEKVLVENHDKIIGFAYYLLDYQGVHDKVFDSQSDLFSIFAGMIFLRNIPFANAEHRLLEISKRYDLATLHPEEENVAKFILCHFEHYRRDDLRQIYYRIKNPTPDNRAVKLLYQQCRHELSWWQRLF